MSSTRFISPVFAILFTAVLPSVSRAQCVGGTPDGIKTISEACDDGNGQAGDGCGPTCSVESGYACSAPSLSLLVTEDYPGSGASWNISADGTTGTQTVNTNSPTIGLFSADAMAATYTFDLRVATTDDDDFIGFVLGYSPGEAASASADYLLIDWKQANQVSGGANGTRGLALSRVTNIPTTAQFWGHTGRVQEIARAATLGNTGWADNTTYRFVITYTATSLLVTVDGVTQLNVTGSFPTGQIGFYGLSQREVVYTLVGPRVSTCGAVCGNGLIHGAETCDDGNVVANDGCSTACTIESGYACPTPGALCAPICGDGLVIGGEACDDQNVAPGDGCSATCTVESGYVCTGNMPSSCDTVCGDGVTAGDEACDDDGTADGDGCSSQCRDEIVILVPVDGSSTSDETPTVSGAADAGATITIRVDGNVVGMTTADAGGLYGFDLPLLASGTRVIEASATDGLGHVSTDTVSVVLTSGLAIDLVEPATGSVTSDTTPTISGTIRPGLTVSVSIAGVGVIGTAVADANGIFTIDAPTLVDGAYAITATYTDAGGTTISDTTDVTIDTVAPDLAITGPTGTTADTTPTISGTTEPGLVVTVVVDGTMVGTTTADASGNWSIDVPSALADGEHTISASVVDAAGLTANDAGLFAVDTTTSIAIASPAEGALIVLTTPTITGTTEPFAQVEVFVDGVSVGTTTAGADGSYAITVSTALDGGSHAIRAVATDGTGNTAEDTSSFTVGAGSSDQDGDGVPDVVECPSGSPCPDTDGDGTPDYLDPDDDGDGIPTTTERVNGEDTDSDGDDVPDYLDTDDDDDGVPTEEELDENDATLDTNGDGVPNHLDADDDGDGIPTADERPGDADRDTDDDGVADHLDADDDGDGLLTATERADGAVHGDDVDGDGVPSWLDTDADDDGLFDTDEGREDDDGDGVPNYLDPAEVPTSGAGGVSGGAVCAAGARTSHPAWLALMLAVSALLRRRSTTRRA